MITISIDCLLLDKSRFKEVVRKNGKKAVFCELVLIETPNSQYGDYIVKQSVTKEERQAKKEMPILGNGKNFESQRAQPHANPSPTEPTPTFDDNDDVPF